MLDIVMLWVKLRLHFKFEYCTEFTEIVVMIPVMRRGDYYGALECQEHLESLSKKLRIQRLKEVREQERMIASRACLAYRDCINSRKENRANFLKENKKIDKIILYI